MKKHITGPNLLTDELSEIEEKVYEWEYPSLNLLSKKSNKSDHQQNFKNNSKVIEKTLADFNISVKVTEVNSSPSVTKYFIKILKNVNLNEFVKLSKNIALALASPTGDVRIEAPVPGTSLIGIEISNSSFETISLHQILSLPALNKKDSKLTLPLGIDSAGNNILINLEEQAHLLISGVLESGKTALLNSFITSILFRFSPEEVKLLLIDTKRVELTNYNETPHLLTPVIVEPNKATTALKWACFEMDKRFNKLVEVGVKNISAYNDLAGLTVMPHIVIVIDELADMMMLAPKEVEELIVRIVQMAKVVGIHLIIASQQQPSEVFTNLIRYNIPNRISFKSYTKNDSKVMLNIPGAEKLLPYGDMLYLQNDKFNPIRVQGAFVSDAEIYDLINFLKSQSRKLGYVDLTDERFNPNTTEDCSDRDELFIEAVKLFTNYDKASSSLIQRRLSIGYARAARLVDQLFEAGFLGPADGSRPRDVMNDKIHEFLADLEQEE